LIEQRPLTLRAIPRLFRSVLVADADGRSSQVVLWEPTPASQSLDFTPHLDVLPGAAFLSHRPTQKGSPGETVVVHSADRLAKAIVLATRSPSDPRTLTAWGQQVGVSRGALRVWCKTAGVSARSCLDFLRVLRAVILSGNEAWDLYSLLDVVDQRSLIKLLERGGLRELSREKPPTVERFVADQRFLRNQQVLHAVSRHLNADRRDTS
jgi:hypothetical protein